jgi:hypothetical protein
MTEFATSRLRVAPIATAPDGSDVRGTVGLAVIGLDGTPTCTLWQGVGDQAGWDPDWGMPAAGS